PLSYGLLLAMGVGPAFPYRVARWRVLWARIRRPLQTAALAGALVVAAGVTVPHVVGVVMLAVFIVGVSGRQLWTTGSKFSAREGLSRRKAMTHVMRRDPGYWGGQIAHAGVALVAVANALYGNLGVGAQAQLGVGDSMEVAGYTLTHQGAFNRIEPNREVIGAQVAVARDGRQLEVLEPGLNRYPNLIQAVGTPAVRTSLSDDLYLSLRSIDAEGIVLEAQVFPYMYLLWAGGLIAAAGGLWARRRPVERVRPFGGDHDQQRLATVG
ncbi:MAG: cytochrome c-type biogenesis CcmF C-terminal domain-containing protein, partial [Acidimicrobiia bacterium]